MTALYSLLTSLPTEKSIPKQNIAENITKAIEQSGYIIVETNTDKPWGAYFRLDGEQADQFVEEFFPGLSPSDARLGNDTAELSPKILLVAPNQRLSWQYHDRRAERWAFLNDSAYNKSVSDNPGNIITAQSGDIVQFAQSERHRLIGASDSYTIVAEIWQHADPDNPTDEDDIVRLQDDYQR